MKKSATMFGRVFKKKDIAAPARNVRTVARFTKIAGEGAAMTLMQALETGLQLLQSTRFEEAEQMFGRALDIDPNNFDALHLLGLVAYQTGRSEIAIKLISKAVSINPSDAIAFSNLGEIYRATGSMKEARSSFERSLALRPNRAETHHNLGLLLAADGKFDEAVSSFEKALSINSEFVEARWALTIAQLPAVYETATDLERYRAAFAAKLSELDAWFDSSRSKEGFRAVGVQQPFFLAYQERSNRDLLAQYGRLCERLMREWQVRTGLFSRAPVKRKRVRVGIVSAFVREHAVWNAMVKGWLQYFDHTRFELQVFHLSSDCDEETAFALARAAHTEQGTRDFVQWVEAILAQEPDVLIYPEVGMDPTTVKLASLRLAQVQTVAWGHPETTGLPTIDYYLSAEDFEPPEAQQNYTERLVALPHWGCAYLLTHTEITAPDYLGLEIKKDRPLLICAGSPFKYLPEHDHVFAEIARSLGECQFIFFVGRCPGQSDNLRVRLQNVFALIGLDFEAYVVFIPHQSRPAFHGVMKHATVYLDTIGFSGFNTAIQAVECGLPVVTREGQFMRGRFASGILRRIGVPELIVQSDQAYVELATKLARDSHYREHIRRRLETARKHLFDDVVPIRALESFLLDALKETN